MRSYADGSLSYLNYSESDIAASEQLDDEVTEIEAEFQATLPKLIAEAKETLDKNELAAMTDENYRTWFYENQFIFGKRNEPLQKWLKNH